MKKILFVICIIFMANSASSSDILRKPSERIVITIKGNILHKNTPSEAKFDLPMLLAFKQSEIVTDTPWTTGKTVFEGVLLKELLDYVGASGSEVLATALNGYRISIPYQDIVDFPIVLALKRDGSALSIRKRGPAWVIYPWDDDVQLKDAKYYMRSIWQLKELEIR